MSSRVDVKAVSEKLVLELWQEAKRREDLYAEDGRRIRIIYPGRANDGRGPDIIDAVIAAGGVILSGDIEVHTRTSCWRAHGHHADRRYNRVILHVVFRHDSTAQTTRQGGQQVPTLALMGIPLPSTHPETPCSGAACRMKQPDLDSFLSRAGEQRFKIKAEGYIAEITQEGAGQVLYRGIMGALGYAKNKLPFMELARRVPLRILEEKAGDSTVPAGERALQIRAILTGAAGLLPVNGFTLGKESNQLAGDTEGAGLSPPETSPPMRREDWHLFKVRPGNHPTRRIAAVSHLLVKYGETGLLGEVLGRVKAVAGGTDYRNLEGMFRLPAADRREYVSIGRSRAAVIVVNVVLPFSYAWAAYYSTQGLAEQALRLYRGYPAVAKNAIERHMQRQLGVGNELAGSAMRQQGLIHVYRVLCSAGRCGSCPLAVQ